MKTRADRTPLKTKVTGSLIVDDRFHLVNISDTGALITTPQKLKLGNYYHLNFSFASVEKSMSVSLKALIVRENLKRFAVNKKGEKMPIYEVGLSFIDTSDDDVKMLKTLIVKKELNKVKQ
ncbi:PilZ domain-containing protein [Thermodesulfobacteriota bacterium]